ncbi:hypothetical protein LTR78_009354 [Recurvomyces mirabilis]|uniref:Uncharacterized protein n=1 Tax=Recurvomyces mirabilis TaxID=574656 RepID=A0AAE0TRZ2_9PEZI|nr:hypothetical protein LTR78_009354 [Recurvomyces mirabilis]
MHTPHQEGYGLGDPQMLLKIDRLFACGVGEQIDLPQIVVVGDQSSGKSSVLEGLIRKPLPRDSGLCTRFATQIIFRRADKEEISVSILADRDAPVEERNAIEAWERTEVKALDSDTFSNIMREAHEVMGLDHPSSSSDMRKTFSNHVLRLEVTGPNQEHLSVIDVPGIFRNPTPGVTTKSDIALVRRMVLEYMKNARSVMLAVVPANVDIATQEILELAADVDPTGDRTLGVLTKPDLVDGGAEIRVIDIIEGRTLSLKLGWHVVRNPGQQQLLVADTDRDALELDFFRTEAPWKSLSHSHTGIESLRNRLKEVLSGLVQREFPRVKQEINKRFNVAQKQLERLGPERSTVHAQRAYLTEVASRYQRIVSHAVDGKYASDPAFDQHRELRIAPAVTARSKQYSKDMVRYGHEYPFAPQATHLDDNADGINDHEMLEPNEANGSVNIRVVEGDSYDLQDLLQPQCMLSGTKDRDIESWLRQTYQSNRGFELGTFGAYILSSTMRQQSSRWVDISLGYISDVVLIVHRFILKALETICHSHEMAGALAVILTDGHLCLYRKAIGQVRFLLDVERGETPITMNHYFNDNLEKCHGTVIRLDDAKRTHPMSNETHTVQDIHDILRSYYKVAIKRFVDNVLKQATDHFLISGPETPLILFSPLFVSVLSPEDLDHLAGEAMETIRLRTRLDKQLSSLDQARSILKQG